MPKDIFPREVVSNVPRITLTGREQLHIEQHKGLIAYSPEEIVFRTAIGLLRAEGEQMRFRLYTAAEALVVGRIGGLSFMAKEVGK